MTSLAEFLDDFGAPSAPEPAVVAGIAPEQAEAQRLEAFEEGYRAGWDDAVKAQQSDADKFSSAFAQHLSDLSFTYHEANSAMTRAMMPLLEALVATVLPKIARDHFGAHLTEQVQALAAEIGKAPVEIAVAPCRTDAVTTLFETDHGFPVTVVADETLSEDQADIRFADTERQVDLGALVDQITAAIEGFGTETERKVANG